MTVVAIALLAAVVDGSSMVSAKAIIKLVKRTWTMLTLYLIIIFSLTEKRKKETKFAAYTFSNKLIMSFFTSV